LSGCGSSSTSSTASPQQQENRWLNEFGQGFGTYKRAVASVAQDITNAGSNPEQLAAAYARYASATSQEEERLKNTDPPEQCKHLEQTVLNTLNASHAEAARLSSAGAVDTTAEVQQARRTFIAIEAKTIQALGGGPLTRVLRC
jgi:hypothetical protein